MYVIKRRVADETLILPEKPEKESKLMTSD